MRPRFLTGLLIGVPLALVLTLTFTAARVRTDRFAAQINWGGASSGDVGFCGPVCGDDIIIRPEECDNGALNSNTQPDACRTDCRKARCGDGVRDSAETCDDGNTVGGDSCPATCGVGNVSSSGSAGSVSSAAHLECRNQQCVSMAGEGTDLCSSYPACAESHFACRDDRCEGVPGPGSDTCNASIPNQCLAIHTECQGNLCVQVNGSGSDGCSLDSECVNSHLECRSDQCQQIAGAGPNGCANDPECVGVHAECNPITKTCDPVPGAGPDVCSLDPACIESHLECRADQCMQVAGPGQSECSGDPQCVKVHAECNPTTKTCDVVPGEGDDVCAMDSECAVTHLECRNDQCAELPGSGANGCQTDAQCANTHAECDFAADTCVSKPGEGPDLCAVNADCTGDPRAACRNDQCVMVGDPGNPECTSAAQCVPVHTECDPATRRCVTRPGAGLPDACVLDDDCAESHAACLNGSCMIVPGPGPQSCGQCIQSHTECDPVSDTCSLVETPGQNLCNPAVAQCVPTSSSSSSSAGQCGNRSLDPGEACDDGNLRDGDCCSASCAVEPGCVCAAGGSSASGGSSPGCFDSDLRDPSVAGYVEIRGQRWYDTCETHPTTGVPQHVEQTCPRFIPDLVPPAPLQIIVACPSGWQCGSNGACVPGGPAPSAQEIACLQGNQGGPFDPAQAWSGDECSGPLDTGWGDDPNTLLLYERYCGRDGYRNGAMIRCPSSCQNGACR